VAVASRFLPCLGVDAGVSARGGVASGPPRRQLRETDTLEKIRGQCRETDTAQTEGIFEQKHLIFI